MANDTFKKHDKIMYDFFLPMKSDYDNIVDRFNEKPLSEIPTEELEKFLRQVSETRFATHVLSIATKVSANAIYGASGTPIFTYFNEACASDTCAEGRYYCQLMNKVLNDYFSKEWEHDTELHKLLEQQDFADILGFKGIKPKSIHEDLGTYADTDSVYVEFGLIFRSYGLNVPELNQHAAADFIVFMAEHKLNHIFADALDKSFASRHAQNTMSFDLEMIGSKGIFIVSKKYMIPTIWADGVYIAERGQIKSRGVELIQSSSSYYVKDLLKKVINAIFTDRTLDDKKFFRLCASITENAKKVDPIELCKIGRVSKFDEHVISWKDKIELTKGIGGVVYGGARYNQAVYQNKLWNTYPYIKSGSRIYSYYDTDGKIFAFPEEVYPKEIMPELDVDMQLEKLVFNPLKRITSGMFSTEMKRLGNKSASFSFNVKRKK